MFGILTMFGLFAVAHAQGTGDPVAHVVQATSTGWDLVIQFGPIWGGMLLAYGLAAQFVKAGFFQKFAGKRLAGIVALVGVFGAALEAHFGSGSWAGVLVTAVGAIKMLVNPTVVADTKPNTPIVNTTTIASLLIGALLMGGTLIASCGPGKQPVGPVVINGIIDCTVDSGGQIAELIKAFRPKDGHGVNWSDVYEKAKAAGESVGGCALAIFIQDYMTSSTYASTEGYGGADATATLERFRTEVAHGATFHTAKADL